MYSRSFKFLIAALASAGRVFAGQVIQPTHGGPSHQMWKIAGGKNYASRSKYTPGGPHKNCGDRGISPKSVARRQGA